jgi:ketosteroid isomerase-like protein
MRNDHSSRSSSLKSVDVVLEFMKRINQRDPDRLADLMSEDHTFVDSLGGAVCGKERMRQGWKQYFAMCPDYWVVHETIIALEHQIAIFGTAGGTIAGQHDAGLDNHWRTPAAWLAVLHNDLIKEWRVYADNKPVYDILSRSRRPVAD